MQELVGKLSALDPESSESLKVIGFFDKLVSSQANLAALARSAAVLAGVPAGLMDSSTGRVVRATPTGAHSGNGDRASWPCLNGRDSVTVWIEREGAPHINDAMLLERFSLSVSITLSRVNSDARNRVAEIVVDAAASPEERAAAVTRLRLDLHRRVRAIALSAGTPLPSGQVSGLLSTPFGFAQVLIVSESLSGPSTEVGGRTGVGLPVEHTRLPVSWASALVALRLSDHANPIVRADELGPLLLLADAADASPEPHPDVVKLSELASDSSALPTLDAVIDRGSVRGAALVLGLHHSTVQARLAALTESLGYDVRSTIGGMRYTLSRALQRLRDARL
ncbi:helix-turn-helix domain-containing protein [Brevibacterium sp. GP-SGM9]|uniref:helix-turn-helix domain-containing protein n=1 Tax=Brevibacterium sp. GP-SGM9 TaxID=3376990 RepID=UPI0039A6CB85